MARDPKYFPFRVVAYIEPGAEPIRIFGRYETRPKAEEAADRYKAQAAARGWTHTIRIETTATRKETARV